MTVVCKVQDCSLMQGQCQNQFKDSHQWQGPMHHQCPQHQAFLFIPVILTEAPNSLTDPECIWLTAWTFVNQRRRPQFSGRNTLPGSILRHGFNEETSSYVISVARARSRVRNNVCSFECDCTNKIYKVLHVIDLAVCRFFLCVHLANLRSITETLVRKAFPD